MTRPLDLPPAEAFAHGTRARYVAGCRCADCRAANVRRWHERQAAALAALQESATSPAPTSGPCPGFAGEPCRKKSRLRKDSKGGVCGACRERILGGYLVDAEPVRAHLRKLSRQGVGYKSAAAACDVSKTTLAEVLSRKKRTIRKATADRVLQVTKEALADGALVSAGRTWRRINGLLEEGFTRAELARRLGYKSPALQFRRGRITARNALRVQRLEVLGTLVESR